MNKQEIVEKLSKLHAAAEEVLDGVKQDEDKVRGAINWGDLHVVDAEYVLDAQGDEGYRVCIEEADPSVVDLHEAVAGGLEGLGWGRVEVVTEW